jgi:D-alanyl-D-alanine carboxypeptidase
MDVYRLATIGLAWLRLPLDVLAGRWRPRERAAEWALGLRFPREDLTGLDTGARVAFAAARCEALWRHGIVIGLTSGARSAIEQQRLFHEAVLEYGGEAAARQWVLPPAESLHVQGRALDIRPREGARWLEIHGHRYGLYRTYANEWWHFEHWPHSRPTLHDTPASRAPGHTECRFQVDHHR